MLAAKMFRRHRWSREEVEGCLPIPKLTGMRERDNETRRARERETERERQKQREKGRERER